MTPIQFPSPLWERAQKISPTPTADILIANVCYMVDLFADFFAGQIVTIETYSPNEKDDYYMRGDPSVVSYDPTNNLPFDVTIESTTTNWADPMIRWKIESDLKGGFYVVSTAPGPNVYLWCAVRPITGNNPYGTDFNSYLRLTDVKNSTSTWKMYDQPYYGNLVFYMVAGNGYYQLAGLAKMAIVVNEAPWIKTPTRWLVGRVMITVAELQNIITTTLKQGVLDPNKIFMFKGAHSYQPLSFYRVSNFYANNPKPSASISGPYDDEEYNCNAFAWSFQSHVMQEFYKVFPNNDVGPAFGFAAVMVADPVNPANPSVGHSINFYVTPQLELKFVDPQNGQEFPLSEITGIQYLSI